ncbi:MAG: GNAT family N-acetyltransferase [Lachnospiraceae bacterium]
MDYSTVKQVKINIEEGKGILYVTDSSDMARKLAEAGYPVLGILTEKNRQDSFAGVQYLAEEGACLDEEYLERVYRRLNGLPWQILTTPRCIVRETTEADVDAFYKIYAHPSVTRYMENLFEDREEELAYTAQYRKNVYEFYGFGIWTVILKETGEVIGRAGLTMREGFAEPELGFVIGVPWQGQGIAREVCEAILHYGEEELAFETVQALVQPENKVSVALLHALGFEQETEWTENGIRYLRFLWKKQ